MLLSHSRSDRERVRELAERLRADGLRVWPGVFEEQGERLHGVGGGAAMAALREDGLEPLARASAPVCQRRSTVTTERG